MAFTAEGERLIGDAAKNQLTSNPANTIFDVKRLIGRNFEDPTVQKDLKYFPFKVVQKNDKPHVLVESTKGRKIFAVEAISAMVLFKMKVVAESFLGEKVTHAVVTVPAVGEQDKLNVALPINIKCCDDSYCLIYISNLL